MRKYLFLVLLGVLSQLSFAQQNITWEQLADVKFEDRWSDEVEMMYGFPLFGPGVKALADKEVSITGYVLPIDLEAGFYVLSANPYSSCFFCGQAGPESILELRFDVLPRQYKNDEKLTFKGKLRLNDTNIYDLNYILEEVEEL